MHGSGHTIEWTTGLLTAILLLASVCYLRTGSNQTQLPRVVLADLFLFLVLSIGAMAAGLRRCLKVTLYSYLNIGLIGGILFAAGLAGALLFGFVASLGEENFSGRHIYQAILQFPRQFSFGALFVIFAVSMLVGVSNIALIRHEGFCLSHALGIVIACFYIGAAVVIYRVTDLLTPERLAGSGPAVLVLATAVPLFLLLMLCYLECILAGTAIMGWKAARQKPAYDKDYIIILGCSIDRRGGLLPLLKGRVNRAIRFAWQQEIATGKPLLYVPSGGQGPNEVMSEGSAMELYLMTRGAEAYEIFPEKKSRNTWENMRFSKSVIDALNPNAKVAFATTNYHMLRSGILARKAGLDAEGIAGDTKWYFWPNGFVREFFGVLAMNLRTHFSVAAITALLCLLVGWIGYFWNLI